MDGCRIVTSALMSLRNFRPVGVLVCGAAFESAGALPVAPSANPDEAVLSASQARRRVGPSRVSFTLAFRNEPVEARIGHPEGDLAPCSLVSHDVTGSDGLVGSGPIAKRLTATGVPRKSARRTMP